MPRPMGGPGRMNQEKSKDFVGSMKRLIGSLKTWRILLIISLVLAMIAAILGLIAPNKLSDFTDTISKGLMPKTEKLQEISLKIASNFSQENISRKMTTLTSDNSISKEDLLYLNELIEELLVVDSKEQAIGIISKIPDNVLSVLLDDIEVDGIAIPVQDQLKTLKVVSKLSIQAEGRNNLSQLDNLPRSVLSIVKPSIDISKIKKLSIFMGILYVVSSLFSYVQGFSLATISNVFAKELRYKISDKINSLPLKYFDTHENGDILSRITNDVDAIAHNLNQSLSSLVSSLTLFLGSTIMMFYTSWIMAITAILASLLGFMFMFLLLSKSQKYFNQRQEALGDINGYIEEMYSGHNVVKVYNGTQMSIEKFDELNNKLYIANKKSQFLSGMMMPIMNFVGNLGYVAVCIVGALLTMNGKISFGVIVAFIIYVRLFTNPLSQIAQAMTSLQSTAAASERVFEFLDEEEMTDESNLHCHLDKGKVKGAIEFKNVKFGYNPDKMIIKDFSVNVKPGQKIAIVGPTGAGKTTLVNLLMKFYEINQGDIIIDGCSIHELTRENIHDLFCMVLQDTWLFEGTIGENIRFNKENITEKDMWTACKVVGVEHFIQTLPGGMNAEVSDSDTVSQGQKQLFTIARGMLENAPFLILDEATSNVDTRTEELVQKAMDKLTEGKTSFIIAHRLSTIKNADLILVMKDGNIVEQGNHKELIDKKGFYAELYNSQFEL